MIKGIVIYLTIGLIWVLVTDALLTKLSSNWQRFRFITMWPVTFIAFIVGVVQSIIDKE